MTACAGGCGRPGAGHFDSGQPALDKRFTWCDSCWHDLYNKRMPPGLVEYKPYSPPAVPSSAPELSALPPAERKIMPPAGAKTAAAITAAPAGQAGSGSFTGYLAAFGRDHGEDTIMPGAMDESAAAVNAGRIVWHLTDAHSEKASDVVATVTAAAIDRHGLRIEGQWAPTERAQALRQMVRGGHKLGLSIDYYPVASRPDGRGGRYLDKITIVGGAVTPKPMNPAAVITEGKAGAWAPVADVYADAQARHADPGREADDRLLAAASWPPPGMFGRETSLALIRRSAEAKARRELESGAERSRAQARRDRANQYSSDLAEWMSRNAGQPV